MFHNQNFKRNSFPQESNPDPLVENIDPIKLFALASAICNALVNSKYVSDHVDFAKYDVFISHSSAESDFVDSLATHLRHLGLKACYDTRSFNYGGSLLSTMDDGIRTSRLCIAVLSPDYLNSYWCKNELEAILQIEKHNDCRVLLPIWHKVNYQDIVSFSPIVASRKAMSSTNMSTAEMAIEVNRLIIAA